MYAMGMKMPEFMIKRYGILTSSPLAMISERFSEGYIVMDARDPMNKIMADKTWG